MNSTGNGKKNNRTYTRKTVNALKYYTGIGGGQKRPVVKERPKEPGKIRRKAPYLGALGAAGLLYGASVLKGQIPEVRTGTRMTRALPPVQTNLFNSGLGPLATNAISPERAAALANIAKLEAQGVKVTYNKNRWGTPALPATVAARLPSWVPKSLAVNIPAGTYSYNQPSIIPAKWNWNPKGLPIDKYLGNNWSDMAWTAAICAALALGTGVAQYTRIPVNPLIPAAICGAAGARHVPGISYAAVQAVAVGGLGLWAAITEEARMIKNWEKSLARFDSALQANAASKSTELLAKQLVQNGAAAAAAAAAREKKLKQNANNAAAGRSQSAANAAALRALETKLSNNAKQAANARTAAKLAQERALNNRRAAVNEARLALEWTQTALATHKALNDARRNNETAALGLLEAACNTLVKTAPVSVRTGNNPMLLNFSRAGGWGGGQYLTAYPNNNGTGVRRNGGNNGTGVRRNGGNNGTRR